MRQGTLTIQQDGTLTIAQGVPGDATAVEAAVATFAERVSATETQVSYRLTAAAVWHARRTGQTLADILQTLETHSTAALPAKVRAEITRWSQQIDRLTLEVDEGRLLLRSHSPLAITAVRQHRTLKSLVARPVDATTVELHADGYPALVQTFDACSYPVMDRVPPGWKPGAVPVPPAIRSVRPTVLPARAALAQEQRWEHTVGLLRRLPRQCQAITRVGRQCKNRVQPASRYCRVHADWSPRAVPLETYTPEEQLARVMLDGMLEAGLLTLCQLAVARISVLMGLGFVTWLALVFLRLLGVSAYLGLPTWVAAGLVGIGMWGLAGRLLARLRPLASLYVLWIIVSAVVLDVLHKEGLILTICFVVIPVVGPAMLLSYASLSLAWVFLCFPIGLVVGRLFYAILDTPSA